MNNVPNFTPPMPGQMPGPQPTGPAPKKTKAIISMIFGIAATASGYAAFWAIPCIVLAVLAVVFSSQYKKECAATNNPPSAMATVGLVFGIIGIVFSALGLVCTVCTACTCIAGEALV